MQHPLITVTLATCSFVPCLLGERLGAQGDQKKIEAKPDPARVLAQRSAGYAGGVEAYRKLEHLAFRQTLTRSARGVGSDFEVLWLLAPAAKRARWELLAPANQPGGRANPRQIMVLDTGSASRKNLLTVPETPGPEVSLWGGWYRTRRLLFLPFLLLEAKTQVRLLPAAEKDAKGVRRLRVVWPKTRNYEYVDEHELVVEVDTGRIVTATAITGTKGQNRSTFRIDRWTKVGALRLPTKFVLQSGRGKNVAFDTLRVALDLPKDVWSRKTQLIAKLRPKPAPLPTPKKNR